MTTRYDKNTSTLLIIILKVYVDNNTTSTDNGPWEDDGKIIVQQIADLEGALDWLRGERVGGADEARRSHFGHV